MLDGWLLTTEGPICLKPVPLEWLGSLESMLLLVRASEFKAELAQKILDLHPRGDRRNLWGIEFTLLPSESFDEVFGEGGIVEMLNRFVPNDPEPDAEEDPYPPWASGDLRVDYLADLTYFLGSFEQAKMAIEALGIQAIANLLKRLGDHHKGPEGREKAGLKAWYWQHIKEFDSGFYDN
ncbi:MAG: hypothetical protein ACRC62_14055 [Microcoleus sp.]